MSKRQRKLALSGLVMCICGLAVIFAVSAWLLETESSASTVHADEPNPLLIGSVQPPSPPPYDAEEVRAAFSNASTFTAKAEVLRAAGIKPWNPASALPPQTEASQLNLSPESEAAIEDVVSELPEGKRAIARQFLRSKLASSN